MVLCWVNIDQKTGRAQDFSDLGKCSRQQGLYQFVETKLIHCQTAGEPALYQTTDWYRLSCLEHFPKSEKSCTKPVWGQCWPNRDFFHFWLNKNKRKKWMAKIKCLKKPSIISGQVSKLLPRDGCKRPCFDQLNAHIVECLLFCWRPKMCVFSGSKHGRLQSPLGFCYHLSKLLLPSTKALIHGRDQYLLHIQDATKNRIGTPTRQKWKYHGQPRKSLVKGCVIFESFQLS